MKTSMLARCLFLGAALGAASAGAAVFSFIPLDVMLELRYENFSDTTEGARGERLFVAHSRQLIPRVLVQAGAVLFDPRIATLNVGIGLRASRGSVEQLGRPAPDDTADDLKTYNAALYLLPSNRFSLTASTRRTRDSLQLPFVAATELDLHETSWILGMRRMAFPGTLLVQSSEMREAVRGLSRPSVWRKEDTIDYTGSRRWNSSSLRVVARQLDLANRLASSVNSRSQTLSADLDSYDVKPWLEQIRSELALFRRLGAADTESLSLSGAMAVRFGKTLGSSFSANARRDDGLGGRAPQNEFSLAAALHHRLYESLRSNLRVAASRIQANGDRSARQSVDAEVHYSKLLPFNGQLQLHWNEGFENRDVAARTGELRIVGEPHTARVGLSFVLGQPNVIPGSLIVTSDGGGTVYLETADWVVDFVGIRAEVRVLAGGGIADGQPLLVSYRVTLPDRLESRLSKQGGGIELRLGVASVYYRRNVSDERSKTETPLRFSGEQRHEEGGATVSLAARGWTFDGRVLEQRFDSPLSVFDQRAYSATLAFTPNGRFNCFAQHETSNTDFERPLRGQIQRLSAVGLGITPGGRFVLNARLDRRQLSDTLLGEEQHDSLAVNLQWSYGKLAISGFASITESRRGQTRTRSNRAFVSVLRRL